MKFNAFQSENKNGFTFVELLIVIAIIAILSTVIVAALVNVRNARELDYATKEVRQIFEQARSNTLASQDDSNWGVAANGSSVTLFPGTVYDPNDPDNEVFELPNTIEMANIDFNGGTEVYFLLGSGEASDPGTLEVRRKSDISSAHVITVTKTGIVNTQKQ